MAEIQEKESGKKKKGAQKKMHIHVDFTPMVDMNMLLITFFMLCTTMIKSQTLQLTLPSNDSNIKKEQQNQAKESEALTLILDTEYTDNGKPKVDPNTGKTVHSVYWYQGMADTTFQKADFLNKEEFLGDAKENGVKTQQGIRKVLRERNKEVMAKYDEYKEKYRNKEISKEVFDSLAKANAADSLLTRPVVIIKPGPNATYEALIHALDEMNINQIARYSIQMPTHADTLLLQALEQKTGQKLINPNVR